MTFPFNWVPLREGTCPSANVVIIRSAVSIQLGSPARGDIARPIIVVVPQSSFHSIGFPCERGLLTTESSDFAIASFHSIGFPCERGPDWCPCKNVHPHVTVSIQLGSPARGDTFIITLPPPVILNRFPFNWVPLREGTLTRRRSCSVSPPSFHSIGFPCERGLAALPRPPANRRTGFHSIGFPCERGLTAPPGLAMPQQPEVRFPFNWVPLREGTGAREPERGPTRGGFHSIGFPCERGPLLPATRFWPHFKFPFNWVPLREGTSELDSIPRLPITGVFPFNWVPLREGTSSI